MFSFPGFLPNKATVQGDHFLGSLFSADVAGSLARVPPAPTIFLLIGLKLSRFFLFFFSGTAMEWLANKEKSPLGPTPLWCGRGCSGLIY